MFSRSRSRYGPFISAGVGVALIIFALAVTSASRLVLVVGGLAIVVGLVGGISRMSRRSPGQQHRRP